MKRGLNAMPSNPIDDQLLRSYLLGELPEEEADRLERTLLEDDESFELCEAVEADLLAGLDRGELSSTEKNRVLQRLAASPQGRGRLALARSLNAAADRLAAPGPNVVSIFSRRTPIRWAALAAAVLVAVIGAWFAGQTLQQRGTGRQTVNNIVGPANPTPPAPQGRPIPPATETPVTKEPQPEPDRLALEKKPAPPLQAQQAAPVTFPFTLSLMTMRGAEELAKLRIPPGTDVVKIQLIDLEGLEGSFDVAVRSKELGTIWEKGGLRLVDPAAAVVLNVPAQRLTPGHYTVAITTGTETLTQEFEVVRESQ